MNYKKIFITSVTAISIISGTTLPVFSYEFSDFVKDNFSWVRSKTISTLNEQTFVQDMSDVELNKYKKKYGDPGYIAYVDTWCGNQIYGQGYRNRLSRIIGRSGIVDGVNATWRYEDGKVNCYFRTTGPLNN
jgi:hypothetical protein